MEFRTLVDLPKKELSITHSDKILLLGSCFSENIGKQLQLNKFNCEVNPFGILYNPISIANAIRAIQNKKTFEESDLFQSRGLYHSFMHHGSFSASTAADTLHNIHTRLKTATDHFDQLNYLLITFGTAYIYQSNTTGEVVANCHKLPDNKFQRRLLIVDEIVQNYRSIIKDLLSKNTDLKFLFSVSPIRHLKDGMHQNQLSKSVLLLAIESLRSEFPESVFYFPSYEIVVDELRDYRFYAEDMLHPSSVAVTYLWNSFVNSYFSAQTKQIMREWDEINKALQHKPFHPHSEQHKSFLTQIVLKIEQLKLKYPFLDVEKEIRLCRTV